MLSHIHHKGVGHQGFLFHHTVTERPQSTIKSDPLLFSLHEKTGAFTFHLGFQCVISVLKKTTTTTTTTKEKHHTQGLQIWVLLEAPKKFLHKLLHEGETSSLNLIQAQFYSVLRN